MIKLILQSVKQLILWSVVTGVVYPLVITVIAQAAFHNQANGSLVERDGKLIGSALLAQQFTGSNYFWPRPSACTYGIQSGRHCGFERQQPGADQRRAANQRHEQRRSLHQREQSADQYGGAGGHGLCLRQRIGPAHQSRSRPASDRPRGRRAWIEPGQSQ